MDLKNKTIGFAITGSFCTHDKIIPVVEKLVNSGANVIPIISEITSCTDTRFGTAADFKKKLVEITKNEIIDSVVTAEPIGPKKLLDILVIAPASGNTIAKLANAITDSTVTMAAKAHLRNESPLVIGISTNDGLGGNAKNIGLLLNINNIYFVPFGQDDAIKKSKSLVADFNLIPDTLEKALEGKQIQPLLI